MHGQAVFPIVLAKPPPLDGTTPSGGNALDEVVGAGVNFLKVGPATVPWTEADITDAKAWDQAAAARGVFTWVNLSTLSRATPGSSQNTSSQDTLLHDVVGSLLQDPSATGIGMWKGADEPWWAGTAPAALQFPYCLVTSRGKESWCAGEQPLDPSHLWVTIEAPRGTASDLAPYSSVTDTHGVDVYPVTLKATDPDLHQVGIWTNTIASITPDHNVWTTLQVCASGSSDGSGNFVLPTKVQERYMIYDSIVNGARGLAFYGGNIPGCWNAQDQSLGWNWTFWNGVLKGLIGEIDATSPIGPALLDADSTRQVTTSDATTEAISRNGANGDLWVIATRSGTGTADVTISGLPSDVTGGTVYTEGRSVSVKDGSFTDSFDRWGVHAYELHTG